MHARATLAIAAGEFICSDSSSTATAAIPPVRYYEVVILLFVYMG